MKKKYFYLISTMVMIGLFVFIGLFIWTMPEANIEIDLIGNWKVYQYNQQSIEAEFICFKENEMFDYRDDWITPYAKGKYEIKDNQLFIPNLNKEYQIQVISDNQIILVEDNQSRTCLFRVNEINATFNKEALYQNWSVLYHAGKKVSNEVVIISENDIYDYRDNKLYMQAPYQWVDDNTFYVDDLQSEFDVYFINDDKMILYQVNGGYVWEVEDKHE